jgi:hypothetical protein
MNENEIWMPTPQDVDMYVSAEAKVHAHYHVRQRWFEEEKSKPAWEPAEPAD